MQVTGTAIDGVLLLSSVRHEDERGYFLESFRLSALEAAGVRAAFVQDNESCSRTRGTLRGLHFQLPPRAQGKLVRVVRGAVLDVAVDLRRASATFGQHVAVELSAEAANQLWVPPGFAHGVCTLVPETIIVYKVTDYWSPQHERTLRFDDPALGIAWPFPADSLLLNARDKLAPALAELDAYF